MAAHVLGDSTGTNRKAKTCQFSLDSALSPQGILLSHTANELPEFGVNLPAPSFHMSARSPAPVGFPTLTMPADSRIRFHDDQAPAPP